jgi:hypothetical protein
MNREKKLARGKLQQKLSLLPAQVGTTDMGLLAPKNQVIGTTDTVSVLPTIGTTDKDSLAAENQVIGATCTVSVVSHPSKNQPAKQPQTFDRLISQTTWSLETKFWGDDEHPKERLCPKNYSLKLPTTLGIANLKPLPQEHEELENHQNRAP